MSDSNVIKLAQLGAFTDSLTEILRSGARALLTQAVEAEVAGFLAKHADLKTATGQQRVVRHGHLPEREIMTAIGPVAVRQPRVRDREAAVGGEGELGGFVETGEREVPRSRPARLVALRTARIHRERARGRRGPPDLVVVRGGDEKGAGRVDGGAIGVELIRGDIFFWGQLMAGALLGSVPVALVRLSA